MTTDAGTPTPVLMPLRKAMDRAFNLGQTYWQQADHEFTSQHRKADVTMQTFRDLADATCAQYDGSLTAAEAERDALTDFLQRHGFERCDLAACNCGSWHHRRGLPERMREIADALDEAGHPLCNENGNLQINALAELVAERDALRTKADHWHECFTVLERAIVGDTGASAITEAKRLRARVAGLEAIATMLDAVVQGAQEEFVRVPYGASHEDVAQINDWHKMAREARALLAPSSEETK